MVADKRMPPTPLCQSGERIERPNATFIWQFDNVDFTTFSIFICQIGGSLLCIIEEITQKNKHFYQVILEY
jgi:hypothetical protein